jgi:hypothetical protein
MPTLTKPQECVLPGSFSITSAAELFVFLSSTCLLRSSMIALIAAAVSTNARAMVAPYPAKGDTVFHQDRQACTPRRYHATHLCAGLRHNNAPSYSVFCCPKARGRVGSAGAHWTYSLIRTCIRKYRYATRENISKRNLGMKVMKY